MYIATYLHTNGQIVLLDALVVQRVVDLDVRPSVSVFRSLLQIERVLFVRLRRGTGHQAIEHCGISVDAGAIVVQARTQNRDIRKSDFTALYRQKSYTNTL